MSTLPNVLFERVRESIDNRTLELLDERRVTVRRRGWLVRRALLAADVFGLVLSFSTAEALFTQRTQVDRLGLAIESALFAASLPAWVIAAKLAGLYDRDEERADHSTADDVIGVAQLVATVTWLLFGAAYLTNLAHPAIPKLLGFSAFAVVLVPSLRSLARAYCRRQTTYLQNAIIVGTDRVARDIARKLVKHPEYGINLVGFADDDPKPLRLGPELAYLRVLGDVDDVRSLVRLLDVERVIVGFTDDHDRLLHLVRDLNELDVQVDIVPRLFEVLGTDVDVHAVEGLPLVGLRPPHLSRSSAFLKRALDVAGAAIGLLLLAPLFLVAALAIKLDTPGPVFFHQVRMGARGRAFRILKFRTMVVDAEKQRSQLAHLNRHRRSEGPRMFKIVGDPRTTRVGRVLRRFSIDELPQLVNVLLGEMSLVGPRPLVLEEDAFVGAWRRRRLDLRPGMTGLWQVLGRDEIPFEEMVRLDYVYVTSWSLAGDLRLMLRTIPKVIAGAASERTPVVEPVAGLVAHGNS